MEKIDPHSRRHAYSGDGIGECIYDTIVAKQRYEYEDAAFTLGVLLPNVEPILIKLTGVHTWPEVTIVARPDTPPAVFWSVP